MVWRRGLPPFRQKAGARMGHPAFVSLRAWLLASPVVLLSRARLGGAFDVKFFTFDDGVGRVLDDLVGGGEAGDDLCGGAVVLADDDGDEGRDIAVDHSGDAQPF